MVEREAYKTVEHIFCINSLAPSMENEGKNDLDV